MLAFSAALLLSFVPAWLYAYIVYWFDRFEREPKKLLFVVFLWGAFVATIGAVIAEWILGESVLALTQDESLADLATTSFFAPLVEESLKGIAILLVAWVFRSEFDTLLDGIVYAGIVALGFAATENVFYLFGGYDEKGWGFFFALFFLRVILTGWNHAAFTAFTGIGIAYARLNKNVLIRVGAPFAGWTLAVVLHG
ncbi:MAG: PrsW family intramembrane metalloprotease, partial [Chloroflexi bacterium]|nr:PrsW family intramembrane metalloprotease [Chloroflexota bacterium]